MNARDMTVLLPEPIEEDARNLLESRGTREGS
jgi:hypothetical protein